MIYSFYFLSNIYTFYPLLCVWVAIILPFSDPDHILKESFVEDFNFVAFWFYIIFNY